MNVFYHQNYSHDQIQKIGYFEFMQKNLIFFYFQYSQIVKRRNF